MELTSWCYSSRTGLTLSSHLKYTIPPAVALTVCYKPLCTSLGIYKILFLITVRLDESELFGTRLIMIRLRSFPQHPGTRTSFTLEYGLTHQTQSLVLPFSKFRLKKSSSSSSKHTIHPFSTYSLASRHFIQSIFEGKHHSTVVIVCGCGDG